MGKGIWMMEVWVAIPLAAALMVATAAFAVALVGMLL